MATIATFTLKSDGSLADTLATPSDSAQIAVVRNARKVKDSEHDYRVINRKHGSELGGGWDVISRNTGEDYVSV